MTCKVLLQFNWLWFFHTLKNIQTNHHVWTWKGWFMHIFFMDFVVQTSYIYGHPYISCLAKSTCLILVLKESSGLIDQRNRPFHKHVTADQPVPSMNRLHKIILLNMLLSSAPSAHQIGTWEVRKAEVQVFIVEGLTGKQMALTSLLTALMPRFIICKFADKDHNCCGRRWQIGSQLYS